jgi:hypothetical protein
MTTSKTVTSINLLEIGTQLALTAKGLQKKCDDSQPLGIMITTDLLAGKIPDLKKLGTVNILKMRKVDDGYKCDAINLYVNDDGEVGIYSPDFQQLSDFECLSYKSGIGGYSIIKHKSGVQLTVDISYSEDHVLELVTDGKNGIEGQGLPLPSYLKLVPQPETPLHNNSIPQNEVLEIISNGKKSRKFGTPLITIKSESGQIFADVIANAAVQRIYENHGIGSKFKIVGKRAKKNKEGQPIDSDGNVSTNKHAWIVDIVDCQAPQFDDL